MDVRLRLSPLQPSMERNEKARFVSDTLNSNLGRLPCAEPDRLIRRMSPSPPLLVSGVENRRKEAEVASSRCIIEADDPARFYSGTIWRETLAGGIRRDVERNGEWVRRRYSV